MIQLLIKFSYLYQQKTSEISSEGMKSINFGNIHSPCQSQTHQESSLQYCDPISYGRQSLGHRQINNNNINLDQLINIYQKQNEYYSLANKQLTKQVRQIMHHQNQLQQKVIQLQNYRNSLLKNVKKHQQIKMEQQDKQNINIFQHWQKRTVKKSENQSKITIDTLKGQFQKLVSLTTKQQNLNKRKQLRKQLASIANQIKKLKEYDGLKKYLFDDLTN